MSSFSWLRFDDFQRINIYIKPSKTVNLGIKKTVIQRLYIHVVVVYLSTVQAFLVYVEVLK